MAAPVKTATEWQWPTEVVSFAITHNLDSYLEPLLEITRRLFPTARRLAVRVDKDPEIRDEAHIAFEVEVAGLTPVEAVAADREWGRELFRIHPSPRQHDFVLLINLRSR
jgi:hypothetical protein